MLPELIAKQYMADQRANFTRWVGLLPAVGTKVFLSQCFAVPDGRTGRVTTASVDKMLYAVRLDQYVDGLELWANEVIWGADDIDQALAEVLPQ